MNKVFRGLFVLVLFLFGAAAFAQTPKDENLVVEIPDSKNYYHAWKDVDRKNRFMLIEYVPKGQTVHNWREMVTTSVNYRNLPVTPKTYARKVMALSQEQCGGPQGKILKTGKSNGYPFALFFYGCTKSPATGKPEWNLTVAFKGRDSFYSVSKAWIRKPAQSAVAEWRAILGKAYVCDTRRQSRPCHSTPDVYDTINN